MRERIRSAGTPLGPSLALAAILLAAAVLVVVLTRGLTFYYDEWNFILDRRGFTPDTFLQPHNEHFVALPIAVYKVMLQVFGLNDYWAFRLMIAASDAAIALLVYLFARPRLGPWLALAPAAVVAFFGQGWENMLWPFQIGVLISVGCGVAALLALDRGTRPGDRVAAALLAVGLAGGSVGLPVVAGVLAELIFRRQLRARWWVVGAPVALYALWWIPYHASTFNSDNLSKAPSFAVDMASAAAGGLLGTGLDNGRVALLLAAIVFALVVLLRRERVTPRLLGILATAAAFWVATAITRADLGVPGGSRYVHVGAIFLLLALVELGRGRIRSLWAGALVAAVAAISIVGNLDSYEAGRAHFKLFSDEVRPTLAALEVARGVTPDPNVAPEPFWGPAIRSAPYLAAVDSFGSASGIDTNDIASVPATQRQKLDVSLAKVLQLALVPVPAPAPGAAPPVVLTPDGMRAARAGPSCLRLVVERRGGTLVLRPPAGAAGLALRSEKAATVSAGRFVAGIGIALAPLPARTWSGLSLPLGASQTPWRVLVAPVAAVRVCAVFAVPGG